MTKTLAIFFPVCRDGRSRAVMNPRRIFGLPGSRVHRRGRDARDHRYIPADRSMPVAEIGCTRGTRTGYPPGAGEKRSRLYNGAGEAPQTTLPVNRRAAPVPPALVEIP